MSETDFKISEKQYSDAHQTFNLFDKRGDGTVSTKDLGSLFKSLALQIDDNKLKDWADDVDEDATGYIQWDAFKAIFEVKLKEDNEEKELKDAFRVLDKDNKGVIDVKDLKWILISLDKDLTEEEVNDMIAETDTDGSGTVDYEEFRNLMVSE